MASPTASLVLSKYGTTSSRSRVKQRHADDEDLNTKMVLAAGHTSGAMKENESMIRRRILSRGNLRYLVMAFVLAFYKCKAQNVIVSDMATPDPATQLRPCRHMLDCNSEGSACTYFYPTTFFDSSSSPGYKFRGAAHRQRYGNPNRSFDANWIRTFNPELPYNETAYPPNDFTYIHMKNTAGITLRNVMQKFAHGHEPCIAQDMFTKSTKSSSRLAEIGEEASVKEMRELATTTTFYAFASDPISRFVSAMGQFKAVRTESYANRHCPELQQLSNGNDEFARQEIKCVLRSVKEGKEVDDHFVLATHDMYQMMFGVNARVAVFSISKLTDFLMSLGVEQDPLTAASGDKSLYDNPSIFDNNMIRDICMVYEPDVHMLRMVGIPVPQCDEHVNTDVS